MMQITVAAVGRLPKRAPERALIDDYRTRFERTGRALGLGPLTECEVEVRRGPTGPGPEAEAIARVLPEGGIVVALDERGLDLTSPEFAARIADFRDRGCRDTAFVIGGADGLDPGFRARADAVVSFGNMVWPHVLARVMLFEQLYRAATILSGGPYHRA